MPKENQDPRKEDRQDPEDRERETTRAPDESGARADRHWQMPEINFATFILSLNHATLVHLGVIDDPAAGGKNKNLALAKQTINILGLLEAKTQGNLSGDEAAMLKNILYDLRIIYIREKG